MNFLHDAAAAIAKRGNAETSGRTAFGKVSIIRVSRLPRLDAGGHSPAMNHMTAASVTTMEAFS